MFSIRCRKHEFIKDFLLLDIQNLVITQITIYGNTTELKRTLINWQRLRTISIPIKWRVFVLQSCI